MGYIVHFDSSVQAAWSTSICSKEFEKKKTFIFKKKGWSSHKGQNAELKSSFVCALSGKPLGGKTWDELISMMEPRYIEHMGILVSRESKSWRGIFMYVSKNGKSMQKHKYGKGPLYLTEILLKSCPKAK